MPRGFKVCPECEAQLGPRTKVCECGHEFAFAAACRKRASKATATTPSVLTRDPSEVIRVTDPSDVAGLIEQLKACHEAGLQTGGCYSAFIPHKRGKLQIEMQFPTRHVKSMRE